jgi:hypothetical protein
VDAEILLAAVVVDDADRREAESPRLQHLADDELAGIARSDDEHLLAPRHEPAGSRPLEDRPRGEARAGNEGQEQEPVDDGYPAG